MLARILQPFAWLMFLISSLALATPGDVDPTFVYPRPQALEPDSTNAVPLADGFLVIKVRNFGTPGVDSTLEATRIDEDGRNVASYGIGGTVTVHLPGAVNVATAAKRLPDGSVLLGGFRAEPGSSDHNVAALVKLDPGGRLDPAFGTGGVATFDVDGDLVRVAAIDTAYGDAILAAVWSRTQAVTYDCSYDRITLFQLSTSGTAPVPIYRTPVRTSFDASCRDTVSLRFLDSYAYYGFNSICDDSTLLADAQALVLLQGVNLCRRMSGGGIFYLDDPRSNRLGLAAPGPAGGGIRFMVDYNPPVGVSTSALILPPVAPLGTLAGYHGAVLPTALVADGKSGAWYLGFANDFGEAGLAKFRADGVLDESWGGGDGVVPIVGSGRPGAQDGALNVAEGLATDVRMVSVRPSGNVVVATADGIVQRFLGPSADFPKAWLAIRPLSITVAESTPHASLTVARHGSSEGAVGVDYEVFVPSQCDATTGVGCADASRGLAAPGSDFVAASGHLDWSDGDVQDREIVVSILDDAVQERLEKFYVRLKEPSGGAIVAGLAEVTIIDDDPPSRSRGGSAGGTAGDGHSGGGGAMGAATLGLLLLGVCAHRNARSRCFRGPLIGPGTLTLVAMLLLEASGAWAAPGDVDPTFVYPRPTVLEPDSTNAIALPNGFILVKSRMAGAAGANSMLALTLIDEDGRVLTDQFGRDGTVTNEIPGAVNVSMAASRALDGTMLFGGYQQFAGSVGGSIGAVVRVDSTGHLDPGFGVGGVATLDVQGDLDRVVGVGALDDGRVAVLVWSRLESNYYDCDTDRATLVLMRPDGRGFDMQAVSDRDSFATESCRTAVTLQVLPGSSIIYGNEVGIWNGTGGAFTRTNWRYGPFSWIPDRGLYYTTVEGSGIEVQAPNTPMRSSTGRFRTVGWAVGYSGPITWNSMAVDDARARLYVGFSNDGGRAGVARFLTDGSVDTSWGGDGLAPIEGSGRAGVEPADYGPAADVRLLSIRANGDLVVATADGILQRFNGGVGPAHGALIMTSSQVTPEAGGRILVQVNREGGSAGPVSVDYAVDSCEAILGGSCTSTKWMSPATAGVEFKQQSGRLNRSDGDSSPRVIAVEIHDDDEQEPDEYFLIRLSNATGGATILTAPLNLVISASDAPTTTPTPATGSNSGGSGTGSSSGSRSGGGGATSWSFLALVGCCLLFRRRATAPLRRRRFLIALALTALASETHVAQARIGDMDPTFGSDGVSRLDVIGLPLKDGRLLYRTSGGFGRTDVDGRADATFGNGGERAWPAGFRPGPWARTRDGELLTAGTTVPPQSGLGLALVRLRADGDLDTTFGDGGILTLPSRMTPVSQLPWIEQQVVVQLDGKILVLTEALRGAYDVIEAMEIARLLPDGTPDRTFGLGGIVVIPVGIGAEWVAMDALSDGRIRISGDVSLYLTEMGTSDPGVPTYDPELGAPARHWALGAPTSDGGRVLISRDDDSANSSSYLIARLKADGSLDRRFGQQESGTLTLSN
ncbi:MAG: hypothetical protein FIB04_05665, partial [Gammaproteobacteria bacterium]|nr:hypothetical protein [Gammaproteobacteria bacterium]